MKQSRAAKKFVRSHDRSVRMIKRHWEIWRSSDKALDETDDDLFRAGIVLAVAAMDSYFTDRFCEALIPYIRQNGLNKQLKQLLSDSGLTLGKSIEMFDNQRPKRVLSNMVRRHLGTFVTQNFKTVDKLYQCIGFAKPVTLSAQEFTYRKRLLRSISTLVERRHKIVHGGDYNQHGRLRAIA
ncbi:HEPN domain-containing protein [Salinisphaera hydrothermalis]|uniref:HEPN domain-containing protein n=1 Tax=Salinisphaera hydrothermalis TaxID=563188 RepID=UPI0012EBEB6E|nr:HEPN domain-containing protein [Salinisphaera hydrothermalis]